MNTAKAIAFKHLFEAVPATKQNHSAGVQLSWSYYPGLTGDSGLISSSLTPACNSRENAYDGVTADIRSRGSGMGSHQCHTKVVDPLHPAVTL